uniref:ATP synthase subunit a n=1 Tax=Olidiana tongmaiensis TaxID=2501809 RepID=A0A898PCX1_9HEMI|nr:ATP synthase F0 subunit 6 [Olidiana tongmaiensis]QSJ61398.1 ATP synthase F0 subunit 6 [Olidiana tongmaiensis]
MNLFSTFDPSTGMMSMNWMSMIIPITMMPIKFWNNLNKTMLIMEKMNKMMLNEIKASLKLKGSSIMMISLMMMILMTNINGLLPYVYTSSAQISFSMAMALPLWISGMMYGWLNKPKSMFIHLIPMGTPPILMPFMVMIESISNIIRPGSLAIRLSANMIAGHLIMALLGSNTNLMTILIMMFMTLMIFETAVSMIQAYVFMTLINLYSSEI